MKVLILESISGLRAQVDSKLFPEGFAILRTITDEFSEAGFRVLSTVNRAVKKNYEEWLSVNKLFDHKELDKAIRSDPDMALIVAPETDEELKRISLKLEKKEIPVLGTLESSIEISGDKLSTYKSLKGKVLQPKTWSRAPKSKVPLVTKPRFGVGSENVRVEDSECKGSSNNKIFQEYIDGEHLSSCLLMGKSEGTVLSLNRQNVKIRKGEISYSGNVIPFNGSDSQKNECEKLALKSARILSMKGYCGVDLILNENPYFIEANPRVTTSFVGLTQIIQENLGDLLIDSLVKRAKIEKPNLNGVSIVGIPKVKRKIKIQDKNLKKLKEIPEISAPPFPHNGSLTKGAELFISVGYGNSKVKAEKKLKKGAEKAFQVLGVSKDDIAWT